MMINTLGMRSTPLSKIQNDLTWYLQNMSKVDQLMVSSHAICIWFLYMSQFSLSNHHQINPSFVYLVVWHDFLEHTLLFPFLSQGLADFPSLVCFVWWLYQKGVHFFFFMFPKCAIIQPYFCGQGPINCRTGLLNPLTSEYLMKEWWHWQNGG